jgi:soluble lytic murein transglycosylase
MISAFDGYKSSPYISVYRALTRQESEYDQYAKSHVGASGLMQLMPATARMTAQKMGKPYCEPCLTNNPAYNISLGTYFLRGLLDNFSGSYVKALAGYNAGPGRISQWTASYGTHTNNIYQMIDWVETIPFSETRNYVQRIIESVQIYRALDKNSKILQVQTADDIRRGV